MGIYNTAILKAMARNLSDIAAQEIGTRGEGFEPQLSIVNQAVGK